MGLDIYHLRVLRSHQTLHLCLKVLKSDRGGEFKIKIHKIFL